MRLKSGASIKGVQTETLVGMQIVDSVYSRIAGHEVTITEVTGGTHMVGSLHPPGYAFDAKTHDVVVNKHHLLEEVKKALQDDFDVILEDEGTPNEHMHCEFQPKEQT